MTAMSVIVAIFIGGIEALGLIGDKLGFEGGLWRLVQGLNDNLANFGFAIAAILIASWLISMLAYRSQGQMKAYRGAVGMDYPARRQES
jgi:high-affinity nickel-transport protein